jgi:glycosyltransferase involved in cell wall biosynthesis
MKFAIIYHVYKNTTSLRESLHSIFSQVDRNFELILINDFSSIAVTNIINEFNFNELKQFTYLKYSQNLGHSYSFNNALNITTSDYVLYAGSNFIFNKNFTKIVNETIDKTSDVDVISFTNIKNDCSVQIFNKLNANMKLLLRQSMKDKIVSVKMLREHKIMLDENLYSPLVYIYQILSAFKK